MIELMNKRYLWAWLFAAIVAVLSATPTLGAPMADSFYQIVNSQCSAGKGWGLDQQIAVCECGFFKTYRYARPVTFLQDRLWEIDGCSDQPNRAGWVAVRFASPDRYWQQLAIVHATTYRIRFGPFQPRLTASARFVGSEFEWWQGPSNRLVFTTGIDNIPSTQRPLTLADFSTFPPTRLPPALRASLERLRRVHERVGEAIRHDRSIRDRSIEPWSLETHRGYYVTHASYSKSTLSLSVRAPGPDDGWMPRCYDPRSRRFFKDPSICDD
jgi:hypothetical protein